MNDRLSTLQIAVLCLYAAGMAGGQLLFKVWVLSFTPLSRAYPFVALAFALTPALGGFVFGEPLSLRLIAGIVLILGGLVLVAG